MEKDEGGSSDEEHKVTTHKRRRLLPRVAAAVTVLLILAGITVLILWLLYRPYKPKFRVVSATVYEINSTSSPSSMSTTMQFTVAARNPNKRVSIFYNDISASVLYRNHPVTPPIMLPPLFQESESTVGFSPVLGGTEVAVAEEVVQGLIMDQGYGVVGLSLILTGKLRYRAPVVFKSTRHYVFFIRCDLFVALKKGFEVPNPLLPSKTGCRVDI